MIFVYPISLVYFSQMNARLMGCLNSGVKRYQVTWESNLANVQSQLHCLAIPFKSAAVNY